MIRYDSDYFGLLQLTIFNGSAAYRTLLPSVFSTLLFLVYKYYFFKGKSALELNPNGDTALLTLHPFVITIYVMAHSLIINHRLNYCYQRYWESCSSIFMMTSKWIDSATTLASFHYQSAVYESDRPMSFGDLDKPLDQWMEMDKKKLAPVGGHKRTVTAVDDDDYAFNMTYYGNEDAESTGTSSSGPSASASTSSSRQSSHSQQKSSNSSRAAAAFDTTSRASSRRGNSASILSRRSFVSFHSRQRFRKYTDSENLRRAKERFARMPRLSDNDTNEGTNADETSPGQTNGPRRSILEVLFQWKTKRKSKTNSSAATVEGVQPPLPPSDGADHSDINQEAKSSPFFRQKHNSPSFIDRTGGGNNNNEGRPKHDTLSARFKASIDNRNGNSDKGTSLFMMPLPSKAEKPKKNRSPKLSKRKSVKKIKSSERHSTMKSSTLRPHRRRPSTDIPVPGVGRTVVKSFKPNPTWQQRNSIAMPRNTGLHSTALSQNTFYHFDFDAILLEEERKRKQEFRSRQLAELKHHFEQKGQAGRRRISLPAMAKNFRPTAILKRSGSHDRDDDNNTQVNPCPDPIERVGSEPTPPTASFSGLGNANDDSTRIQNIKYAGTEAVKITNLYPRLQFSNLPSLHGGQKYLNVGSKKTANKKVNIGFESSRSGLFPSDISNITRNNHKNERQSSFLPPVEKVNRRASLFLQEAAHLYSLMSAVAMASLRADMEGVSSPLVDYVPGQKFPPVNPEEMQIRILVEKIQDTQRSERNPHIAHAGGKIASKNNQDTSEIGGESDDGMGMDSTIVRIKRNNSYFNVLMFLFGLSRNSRQRTIYNASRPFAVLGGISNAEVEMLRKVRGHTAQHALCCLWLREFITREHLNGSTGNVHPPIMARVYQYISDGTAQYNNCCKTAFTDFPFPHAQLTSFFGFVSIFIFPLLFYTYVNNTMVGIMLNLFTVSCFYGILEVALELEEPFIRYPNDVPLNNYQAQFNEALIGSLYSGFHPDAWGDVVDNEGIFGTSNSSRGKSKNSLPSKVEKDNFRKRHSRNTKASRDNSILKTTKPKGRKNWQKSL